MSDDYDLILAYGGTPGEFKNIRYSNKIYIEDPSLRGSLTKLNFDEILNSLVRFYAGKKHPDWLYIGDYDVIPTQRNYLDESIATARRHRCTFAAKSVRDITSSNCRFITEETLDRKLGWCADNKLNRDIRIYHVLGASLLFSWDCLEGMVKFQGRFPQVYNEVGMPTAAALAGHRLLSMDACCNQWAHIRYRPPTLYPNWNTCKKKACPWSILSKISVAFLKIADTLQKAARDQT